jgi:hypothetical protein
MWSDAGTPRLFGCPGMRREDCVFTPQIINHRKILQRPSGGSVWTRLLQSHGASTRNTFAAATPRLQNVIHLGSHDDGNDISATGVLGYYPNTPQHPSRSRLASSPQAKIAVPASTSGATQKRNSRSSGPNRVSFLGSGVRRPRAFAIACQSISRWIRGL